MIFVVRHGQTELNKRFALQGRSNLPLNEAGRAEAKRVGDALKRRGVTFTHVFSSPLDRAIDTARIICGSHPVTVDERLIEMDYGPYEGADLTNISEELRYFFADFIHHPAPEGMEQLSEVVRRTGSFIEDIKGLSGDTLISTHAIAMKGILEYLTPQSKGSFWSKNIRNCEVYAIGVSGNTLEIPYPLDI